MSSTALIASIVGASVAPLLTFVAANKKLSGKVDTSEAKEVWAQTKVILDYQESRLQSSDTRMTDLEKRVTELIEENRILHRKIKELREDR